MAPSSRTYCRHARVVRLGQDITEAATQKTKLRAHQSVRPTNGENETHRTNRRFLTDAKTAEIR